MQSVGGNASSLELAGAGLMLQAEGTGGGLDYSVTDVVAIGGTGGYGNAALSAFDPARAINVVMTGGALGDSFFNAARFDSPGSSSSLTGVTVRSGRGWSVGRRRNAEDRPQQRAGPYRPERDGQRRERQGGGGRQRVRDARRRRRRARGRLATVGAGNSTLIARGSTFLARRSGASAGIRLFKGPSKTGALAAELLNTIVRTESNDPDAYDLDARTDGTVTADFSSFTTRRNLTGGTTPAPGSANNVFGDPGSRTAPPAI